MTQTKITTFIAVKMAFSFHTERVPVEYSEHRESTQCVPHILPVYMSSIISYKKYNYVAHLPD